MLKILLLLLFFQDPRPATPAEFCPGEIEVTRHIGDPTTICGTVPEDPRFLYARARASQSQNGNYQIIHKITFDEITVQETLDGRRWYVLSYTFPAKLTQHWFLNAIYSATDADGNPVLKESVGSNHVKVEVVP